MTSSGKKVMTYIPITSFGQYPIIETTLNYFLIGLHISTSVLESFTVMCMDMVMVMNNMEYMYGLWPIFHGRYTPG